MKNENRIISIVGPESTGKTTLAEQLAAHYDGVVVSEFAREYLNERNGRYEQADLTTIARGQLKTEQEIIDKSNGLVFCDTDILVVLIWHQFKYKQRSLELEKLFDAQQKRKYLLTFPDLVWEADSQRENPNDLMRIFRQYEIALKAMQAEYKVISGIENTRTENAIGAINMLTR